MRLIDADALWEQMKELHQKRCEESDMTGDRAVCVTWHDAVVCIKDAPTIDAVPVVRCMKCRYNPRDGAFIGCPFEHRVHCFPDMYCGFGELREDGDGDD